MTCFVWAAGFVVLGIAIWVTVFNLCFYSTATLLFFKIYLFIICKYAVAVFRHPRRGRQISLRIVVSHYVIAGIWTQDLQKSSQYSYLLSHLSSPLMPFLKLLRTAPPHTQPCKSTSMCRTYSQRWWIFIQWDQSNFILSLDIRMMLASYHVTSCWAESFGCKDKAKEQIGKL